MSQMFAARAPTAIPPAHQPVCKFGTVDVVELERMHRGGGTVPSQGGAPLGMGWRIVNRASAPVSVYAQKQLARGSMEPRAIWVDEAQRQHWLQTMGHTQESLAMEKGELEAIRARRRQVEEKVIQSGM